MKIPTQFGITYKNLTQLSGREFVCFLKNIVFLYKLCVVQSNLLIRAHAIIVPRAEFGQKFQETQLIFHLRTLGENYMVLW